MRKNASALKALAASAALAAGALLAGCDALGGAVEWATYTVIYSANDGSGYMRAAVYRIGAAEDLDGNFERKGHTLLGWKAGGSAVTRGCVNRLVTAAGQTVALCAIWRPNAYGVAYNPNGGIGERALDVRAFAFGEAQSLKSAGELGFAHGHLFFHGWAREPGAGEWEIGDGADALSLSAQDGDVVELFALWGPGCIAISFAVPDGASPVPAARVKAGGSIMLPGADRFGYSLVGWSAAPPGERPGGEGEFDFCLEEPFAPRAIGDITLHAAWHYVGFEAYINWFAAPVGSGPFTSAIKLEFFEPVPWLRAGQIEIAGAGGEIAAGGLADSGCGALWLLEVAGIERPGTVSVSIDSPGIARQSRAVPISAITWAASARGALATSAIDLEFSAPVPELAAGHVSIADGTGAVTAGALAGGGSSWSLAIASVERPGTVSISVAKRGVAGASGYATVSAAAAAPEPESVEMSAHAPTMIRGGYPQQFSAAVLPAGSPQALAWSVYPQIAGVSISAASGLLMIGGTTVADGQALTVTAAVPGAALSASAAVTVLVPPTGVAVEPRYAAMIRGGEPRQFSAAVAPAGASQAVEWSVYPEIAGVWISQGGALTVGGEAAADGAVLTVTAMAPGAGISGAATVTVAVPPESVAVEPRYAAMIRGGEPQQFFAAVLPQGSPQAVEWSVYPEIAGVWISQGGALTVGGEAAADGAALTVTAMAPGAGISGAATVTVLVPPESVRVAPESASALRGGALQLSAAVEPAGAPQSVEWSVSAAPGGALGGTEISAQGLLTVGAAASGALVVRAAASGHPAIAGEATVSVPSREFFAITLAHFEDSAPGYIIGPDVSYLALRFEDAAIVISVDEPQRFGGGIRWFVGGSPAPAGAVSGGGATLTLTHAQINRIGPHRVTAEVTINGRPYSRTIAFEVTP